MTCGFFIAVRGWRQSKKELILLFEDMAAEKMAYRMVENGKTANGVWKGHNGLVIMKKLASKALLLVLAACAMAGCGRRELLQVEQIIECDVETADSLIYSMNEPTGKRSRALYALLKTQIDYKMYRNADSDSTIRVATDYYGRKYKGYHAAMAWYSLGCISAEFGNDSTAADAYLTAIRLFPDTLVRYYALAEQNLSYIYLEHNMDTEALPIIKACLANASRLKDSVAIAFCEFNIARSMLLGNEYETARSIFLKLKDSEWMSPSTKDIPLLELSKIALYKDSDYISALYYVDSFIDKNGHNNSYGAAYTTKASIFVSLNQLDSALHYYRLSLTDTNDPYTICNTYSCLAEIHSLKGDQDSATYYTKQVSEWADSIVCTSNSELIFRALLNNAHSSSEPKSKILTLIIILIVVICVLSLAILLIHYSSIKLKKPQSIADYAKDIDAFKKGELHKKMIDNILMPEDLTVKTRSAIENEFHKSLPGLRKFIISSSSNLNNMEIDYCVFTILGFKPRDFHLFFSISYSGSRKFKARIKEKMKENVFNEIFGIDKSGTIS